jgi:hypothetical protein
MADRTPFTVIAHVIAIPAAQAHAAAAVLLSRGPRVPATGRRDPASQQPVAGRLTGRQVGEAASVLNSGLDEWDVTALLRVPGTTRLTVYPGTVLSLPCEYLYGTLSRHVSPACWYPPDRHNSQTLRVTSAL